MKTPVLEPLFNKVADPQACNFKKENPTQVFSSEYCEIFKNTYFEKQLQTAASVNLSRFNAYLTDFRSVLHFVSILC